MNNDIRQDWIKTATKIIQLSACWLIQQVWTNASNITSRSLRNIYYFKNHTYMTETINPQSISKNAGKLQTVLCPCQR